MRYTKENARHAFELLAKTLGKSTETYTKQADGSNKANVGAWSLDYNGIYGGCVVHEICNEGGGVSEPLHASRMTPRDFCEAVNFALAAIEIYRAHNTAVGCINI